MAGCSQKKGHMTGMGFQWISKSIKWWRYFSKLRSNGIISGANYISTWVTIISCYSNMYIMVSQHLPFVTSVVTYIYPPATILLQPFINWSFFSLECLHFNSHCDFTNFPQLWHCKHDQDNSRCLHDTSMPSIKACTYNTTWKCWNVSTNY